MNLRSPFLETLSDPVDASDAVHYQFSEITDGGDEGIGEAIVRESAERSPSTARLHRIFPSIKSNWSESTQMVTASFAFNLSAIKP